MKRAVADPRCLVRRSFLVANVLFFSCRRQRHCVPTVSSASWCFASPFHFQEKHYSAPVLSGAARRRGEKAVNKLLSEAEEQALCEDLVAGIPVAPQTLKLSTLYQNFTATSPDVQAAEPHVDRRKYIRERYRTIKNLLLHLCHENDENHWGVYLSFDCVFVTRATSEEEAGVAFQRMYDFDTTTTNHDKHRAVSSPSAAGTGASGRCVSPTAMKRHCQLPSISPSEFLPNDYCYPVEPSPSSNPPDNDGADVPPFAQVRLRRTAVASQLALRSPALADSLLEVYLTNFGDSFTPPPPPVTGTLLAPSLTATADLPSGRALQQRQSSSPSTFTPQMLVTLLPTYFVPLERFLSQLPAGYSAAHVERIFGETGCIDLVTLPVGRRVAVTSPKEGGRGAGEQTGSRGFGGGGGEPDRPQQDELSSFIRLHGGRSQVSFGVSATSEKRQRAQRLASDSAFCGEDAFEDESALSVHEQFSPFYEPDPFLCDAFALALNYGDEQSSGPFCWRPLSSVVHRDFTPEHLLRGLGPFAKAEMLSLVFFAQMQHRFRFAADHGGFLCTTGSIESASLREETTPTPVALAEVVQVLQEKEQVYVVDLEQDYDCADGEGALIGHTDEDARRGGSQDASLRLSDFTKKQILSFYGTLRHFLACHPDIFHCVDAATATKTTTTAGSGGGQSRQTVGTAGQGQLAEGAGSHHPHQSGFANTTLLDFVRQLRSPTLTVRLTPSRARHHRMTGRLSSSFSAASSSAFTGESPHANRSVASSSSSAAAATAAASTAGEDERQRGLAATASPNATSLTAALTWEDKLEKALVRKDRRAAQKARRRLAIERNPDSPFADPKVLLDAVLRYLPVRRPVSLRYFVKSLPSSIADFLPEVPLQFFKNAAPEKVQLFEWRRRNHLFLLRPGLPLPDGKLRDRYSETELLFMIAEELTRFSHRKSGKDGGDMSHSAESLSSLFSRLPYGARLCLGYSNKAFFHFLQRYPQFFLIVFSDATRMDVRSAKITLLVAPSIAPEELGVDMQTSDFWDAACDVPTPQELEDGRRSDEAAMAERLREVELEESADE